MDPGAAFDRDYFERSYSDYDLQNPARKLEFYRGLVERAASGIERPRILDIGCAFGKFLATLDPRWQRFGLDVSEYAIQQARRSVPNATFQVGSAAQIPFDVAFDVVTAFDVLEHLTSLERLRTAVRSKLRWGGYFIFVVPVYDGVTGPIIRRLDRDTTHVQKMSRDFWLAWSREGFSLVGWRGVFRGTLFRRLYIHHPTSLLRRFTPAIVVIARNERISCDGAGDRP